MIVTVLSAWFTTARSGIPSVFRSPAAMATGVVPTAIGELFGSVNNTLLLESREPSKIVTLLVVSFTTARSTSGAVVFGNFVFLKLAVASATGLFSLMVALFCSAKGDAGNAVNPPFPSPLKTEMVLSPLFATAKSKSPSPLKSATTTELGSFPAGYGDPAASTNVPSPFPSNTVTLFEVELAITKSTGATVTPLELTTVFPNVPVAIDTGPVSPFASTNGDLACAVKLPLS